MQFQFKLLLSEFCGRLEYKLLNSLEMSMVLSFITSVTLSSIFMKDFGFLPFFIVFQAGLDIIFKVSMTGYNY